MANGSTLLEITEMVRAEAKRSTSASRGIDDLSNIHTVIRRVYAWLYDSYNWPHMNAVRDVTTSAGSRYYDGPSDLNYDRIFMDKVVTRYGNLWVPVDYGIDEVQYNDIDPENNDRYDPIIRWQLIDVGQGEQIEVWPLPASSGKLRLRGTRNANLLIANDDTCDLDDIAVSLLAAAEVMKDGGSKLNAGLARIRKLRANAPQKRSFSMLGGRPRDPRPMDKELRVVTVSN